MYLAVLSELTEEEYQWLLLEARRLGFFKEQEGQPKPSARQVAAKLLKETIRLRKAEDYNRINEALNVNMEYRLSERHNL